LCLLRVLCVLINFAVYWNTDDTDFTDLRCFVSLCFSVFSTVLHCLVFRSLRSNLIVVFGTQMTLILLIYAVLNHCVPLCLTLCYTVQLFVLCVLIVIAVLR